MSTTIRIPRAHAKRLKAFDSLPEVNRWGSDVDARIDEIIHSLSDTQRAIKEITRSTGAASIGLHAPNHRPASGSDPLATAAPLSILGGTSSNSVGTGNSFSRNDHSHDVATASPAFVLGTTASEGSSNSLARVDAGIALFDVTVPAALASVAATGSAAFAARRDHVHAFAPTLQSLANLATLTITDDGTDMTATASLGLLNIVPGTGISINFPNSTAATLSIKPNTTTAAANLVLVQGRPAAGTRTLMAPNWLGAAATDVFTSQTFRCWDSQFSSWVSGQITSCTIAPYDVSVCTIAPSASSGGSNNLYGYRCASFQINNTNATWAEVATGFFKGLRRSISSPTVTTLAGVIIEAPTGAVNSAGEQIGLLVRPQSSLQLAPTTWIGLDVAVATNGTNRYSVRLANALQVSNPSGIAQSVLELRQLNTGATAGAHANLDDKAGDPASPATGDLWRNGNRLYYKHSARKEDLIPSMARTMMLASN